MAFLVNLLSIILIKQKFKMKPGICSNIQQVIAYFISYGISLVIIEVIFENVLVLDYSKPYIAIFSSSVPYLSAFPTVYFIFIILNLNLFKTRDLTLFI